MGKRFVAGALFGLLLGAAFSWGAEPKAVPKAAATPGASITLTCMSDGSLKAVPGGTQP